MAVVSLRPIDFREFDMSTSTVFQAVSTEPEVELTYDDTLSGDLGDGGHILDPSGRHDRHAA